MKNPFEEAIFDIERNRPMSWFLKQKDRLNALHPDIPETMVHKGILIECDGDCENAIRGLYKCYGDITTRTKIEREITVIKQVKNINKEIFVADKSIEAQMSPELTLEMKEEPTEILFQYREAFASDNEPLGDIKGHEVDIMINVERLYPPLLRCTAYLHSTRSREELATNIN
ncbi:hypothetical protein O181_006916 [Austropuccinia psidii MF-1]|uniref:Uncharacterized protein n=1 Tax=Austropuccinia psidii MF-1 TaxID=1389203 RepID=A0A9Q3GH62_9BASI|nr:hypothetical protein [Austropuccinia psidii MF-1]